VASIDRLVGHEPQAMLLTHYSRVTEIERLAGELRHQIGELATLGLAADGTPDRAAGCARACGSSCTAGCRTTARRSLYPRSTPSWDVDIELNAQGLEAWLDRDRR
jgi:hypothetical protein